MRIVSGIYKGRKLLAPKGLKTRPTSERVREAVFSMLYGRVEDAAFLDLFAGSGAVGLEAVSRGATHATFVESDREALRCLEKNIAALEAEDQASIVKGDAIQVLKKMSKQEKSFDIIYADPPYDKGQALKTPDSLLVLKVCDTSGVLKNGGVLFIEERMPFDELHASLNRLTYQGCRRYGQSHVWQFVVEVKL